MKKISFFIAFIVFSSLFAFTQNSNTKIATIFTSGGCGCTGSGGPPETFTEHEEVIYKLQLACKKVDFIVDWESSPDVFYDTVKNNMQKALIEMCLKNLVLQLE